MVDVCVTHPLESSAVAAAALGTGVSAEAKDALKRGKYGRTGSGACRFVPCSMKRTADRAVLAPGSALAGRPGIFVRSAVRSLGG